MNTSLNTTFLLMAQYSGMAIIPVEMVCRDYFPQFTPTKFVEKIRAGELKLPLVRLGPGQKAAKGVPLNDLAAYLDNQIDAARKDLEQMHES
jgi:hypothetical protein